MPTQSAAVTARGRAADRASLQAHFARLLLAVWCLGLFFNAMSDGGVLRALRVGFVHFGFLLVAALVLWWLASRSKRAVRRWEQRDAQLAENLDRELAGMRYAVQRSNAGLDTCFVATVAETSKLADAELGSAVRQAITCSYANFAAAVHRRTGEAELSAVVDYLPRQVSGELWLSHREWANAVNSALVASCTTSAGEPIQAILLPSEVGREWLQTLLAEISALLRSPHTAAGRQFDEYAPRIAQCFAPTPVHALEQAQLTGVRLGPGVLFVTAVADSRGNTVISFPAAVAAALGAALGDAIARLNQHSPG